MKTGVILGIRIQTGRVAREEGAIAVAFQMGRPALSIQLAFIFGIRAIIQYWMKSSLVIKRFMNDLRYI